MRCKVCGVYSIESLEKFVTCSKCKADVHVGCANTTRTPTSKFYEWLTGKSYIETVVCITCERKG